MSAVSASDVEPLCRPIWIDNDTVHILRGFQDRLRHPSADYVISDMLYALKPVMAEAASTDTFFFAGRDVEEKISLRDVFRRAAAAPHSMWGIRKPLAPAHEQAMQDMHGFLKSNKVLKEDSFLSDAFRCTVRAAAEIMTRLYAGGGDITLSVRDAAGGLRPCLGVQKGDHPLYPDPH